jgi:hypothetical protein
MEDRIKILSDKKSETLIFFGNNNMKKIGITMSIITTMWYCNSSGLFLSNMLYALIHGSLLNYTGLMDSIRPV